MKDSSFESNYAGRWVAKVHGRIIAQGQTPDQARQAAKASRPKENPEIIFMSAFLNLHPLVGKLKELFPQQEIYLVGGAVRDMLLGRISRDLDFAVPSNGISLARRVAASLRADFMVLDEERDTARVITNDENGERIFLDFAAFRFGNFSANGAGDIETDLRARDFTINALAYDLRTDSIIDPTDGAKDLRAKVIRSCSESTFEDDPVRILRGLRMAAAFGFHLDKTTREQMKLMVSKLSQISPERLRDEFFKILEGPKPDAVIRAMEMLGIFPYLLPELTALKGVEQSLPHVYDVWGHTISVLQHLEGIMGVMTPGYTGDKTNDMLTGFLTLRIGRFREQFRQHFSKALNPERSLISLLFFAALYHDICKPQTKFIDDTGRIRFFDHDVLGADVITERAEQLRLSNDEVQRLRTIVAHHMRFHFHTSRMENDKKEPSRKAIYRFFRDAGPVGVDLIILGLADLRGTRANDITQENWIAALDVARIFLEHYFEKPEEVVAPPRLLNGHELMSELDISPGPVVGKLLEEIRESQAVGKVATREQALEFAREYLKGLS